MIWLPDPDECPIDLTISASGFHAEPVGGRIFRWTWKDREVSRCWFTEPEERQLQRFLREQGSASISLMERYVELRTRSAVFLTMVARYRFGLEIGNGTMPLKTIRAAMSGGANLDRRHVLKRPTRRACLSFADMTSPDLVVVSRACRHLRSVVA